MTTAERIRKIVVEHLGVGADQVVPEAKLVDDLGADSLDGLELVMAIEEEFGIELHDESELEGINTFGDLVALVDKETAR